MLINDPSTQAVFGSGQRFKSFRRMDICADLQEIWVSASHLLSTEVQPGDLENTRLNKSETSLLSFYWLVQAHILQKKDKGDTHLLSQLKENCQKRETPVIQKNGLREKGSSCFMYSPLGWQTHLKSVFLPYMLELYNELSPLATTIKSAPESQHFQRNSLFLFQTCHS